MQTHYASTISLIFALLPMFMGQMQVADAGPLAAREARDLDLDLFGRDSVSLKINNKCDYDVYVKKIIGSDNGSIDTLSAGKSMSYDTPTSVESAVLKASKSNDISQPAQFEWSITDKVYYDISLIDGNPFLNDDGENFIPKKGKSCNKKKLSCDNGDANCADAYYQPDNRQTWTCASVNSFEINLCKN